MTTGTDVRPDLAPDAGVTPIGEARWRRRARMVGRVRALRVQPWEGGAATLECTLVDDSGGITVIFMGRTHLGGLRLGMVMEIEGMVIEHRGRLAVMNPEYVLRDAP